MKQLQKIYAYNNKALVEPAMQNVTESRKAALLKKFLVKITSFCLN